MINRQDLDLKKTKILLELISERMNNLKSEIEKTKLNLENLCEEYNRFSTPLAKLKDGVQLRKDHVIIFNGEDSLFGHYENDEFVEEAWPFDQQFVWFDDCENLGIKWEQV